MHFPLYLCLGVAALILGYSPWGRRLSARYKQWYSAQPPKGLRTVFQPYFFLAVASVSLVLFPGISKWPAHKVGTILGYILWTVSSFLYIISREKENQE